MREIKKRKVDMLTEFTKDVRIKSNPRPVNNSTYINSVLYGNLEKYMEYMKGSGVVAPNDHPFVVLIKNLYFETRDHIDYLGYLRKHLRSIENSLGFITTKNSGTLLENLSTVNSKGYVISSGTNVMTEGSMVSVKYTDATGLDFTTCNAELEETIIIEINILKVMYVFREWKLKHEFGNVSEFVGSVLLPELWKTKLPLVFLNRFINIKNNEEYLNDKYKNSFVVNIMDVTRDTNKILNSYSVMCFKKTKNFTLKSFLHEFPLLDLKPALLYLGYYYTFKNSWVMPYTRLKLCNEILRIVESTDSMSRNKDLLGEMYLMFKKDRSGYFPPPPTIPYFIRQDYKSSKQELELLF